MLNTHGFIYQNYKEAFVYWEVCILVRKALIAVVVVFAYPLGADLQATLALGVLILAVIVHMLAYPFKYRLLNSLEACSLTVSTCTLLIGLVFNDDKTSHEGFVFLSVVLICINVFLVFAFVYALFYYIDRFLVAKMKSIGVSDIAKTPVSRIVQFTRLHFEKAIEFVRTSAAGKRSDKNRPQEAGSSTVSPPPQETTV